MSSEVVHEGWMVRYGRRMTGQYIHMRYFILNSSRLLAYYEKKPQENQEPIKAMLIDGNCIVEDQGLKTHQGHVRLFFFFGNFIICYVTSLNDKTRMVELYCK
ncbi:hypothetical protein L484_000233 [Morus notabilis]|uniref:PH domain-containing protein n=1 Tax=Morus notabilis TaxID=981085 RepID=W9SEN5_9ROSA|nr:hypothetical protein L484_000233 [Morus notabilis]